MGKDSKLKIDALWIVGFFLLVLFFFFAKESDGAEIEAGPTNLSGDWAHGGILLLSERAGKWTFGGGYVSKQVVQTCHRADAIPPFCRFHLDENIFFQVQRVVNYKRWEMGIGPAYFQNTNRALGRNLNWALSVGYRRDHWSLRIRHWSNAGTGVNLGQDVLTIGYEF